MLTGILRLNVWQMILGSTPFYFMVAPVVLSGSFVVKIYATAGVRRPRRPRRRAAHACSPACAPAQTAEYFMWTSTGLVMGSVRHAPRASRRPRLPPPVWGTPRGATGPRGGSDCGADHDGHGLRLLHRRGVGGGA